MRDWMKLLAIVPVCVALAGCPPQGRPAPHRPHSAPVHADVLAKADLQYYWTIQVARDEGERVVKLYRLDENLYCMTDQNRMIAVDAQRGLPKWSVEIGPLDETVFGPSHCDTVQLPTKVAGIEEMLHPDRSPPTEPFDAVFVNTVHYVLVIDRGTGRIVRKIHFGLASNSGGCSDGEMYYVGGIDGRFHGFSMRESVHVWSLAAEDMISSPLARVKANLYVASRDGYFYCARAARIRRQNWKQKMTGPVTTAFHVDARGCFVPCEDGRLYAFDALSGQNLWDPFICEGPLRRPVQVSKNSIFQYATGDKFYAINLVNGQPRWSHPRARQVLAVMEGNVYLLDSRRALLVVDEMLGQVKTSLPMTGFGVFLPNATAPAIYTATMDGRLYCIRHKSAGYLSIEMLHPEAGKPRVPKKPPAPPPRKVPLPRPKKVPAPPKKPPAPPKKPPAPPEAFPGGGGTE